MIPKYIATLGLRDHFLVAKFQDAFPFVSRCGLLKVEITSCLHMINAVARLNIEAILPVESLRF
jgi:hypothetical protein